MKFVIFYVATSLLWSTNVVAASVQENEASEEYSSMDSKEQSLFVDVLESCSADIEAYCPTDKTEDAGQRRMPFVESVFGDPHRALIEEFDSFVNNFIRPNTQWVVIYDETEQQSNTKKPPFQILHEHELIRNMAISLHPSQFDDVSQRLQSHGNELLKNGSTLELSETGRRVARRLSTITSDELHTIRKSFLPFFDEQNECLDRMYMYNPDTLSSNCHGSLEALHSYRVVLKEKDQREVVSAISTIIITFGILGLVITSGAIIRYRQKDTIQSLKEEQRLRELILAAVYNSVELKKMVENKAGESLGFEPPFLATIRSNRAFLATIRSNFYYHLVVVCAVSFMCSYYFGPIASYCVIIVVLACHSYFTKKNAEKETPICTCCCCDMTSEMARLGTGSKEQLCCECCQGTGVCSISCSSCCNPEKSYKSSNDNGDDYNKLSSCCNTKETSVEMKMKCDLVQVV